MTHTDSGGGAPSRSDAGRRTPVEPRGPRDQRRDSWLALDQSSVMTVELLSAIGVWGGAGWLLDRWLGTSPWLIGLGVVIGFSAGLYLIWLRSAKMLERPHAAATAEPVTEGQARATR